MPYGLYIHWPFCRRKCPYCAFVSYPDSEAAIERYASALRTELKCRREGIFFGAPSTVYLGGGTPSLIPSECIRGVLGDLGIGPETECSIEANPDSLTESWLSAVRDFGVNRLSIGVQSTDDALLDGLGRLHSAERAEWAVRVARKAGFDNVSVDLMFGIPGQTMRTWTETLDRTLGWEIEHVSAYSLGVEEDTPFFERSEKAGLDVPDPSETAEMYAVMVDRLRDSGFRRYEISNFARPGWECRHNQGYWNFTPYLGIGVSAHSFDGAVRWWNETALDAYMKICLSGGIPTVESEPMDHRRRAIEELMLSLRTAEGLPVDEYRRKYSRGCAGMGERIDVLSHEGLVALSPEGNLVLTEAGIMIADEVIAELIPDDDGGENREHLERENV